MHQLVIKEGSVLLMHGVTMKFKKNSGGLFNVVQRGGIYTVLVNKYHKINKTKKNFSFYTSYFFNKITEVQSPEGKDQQILQIMTQ